MAKRTPGLKKRGDIWHFSKRVCGIDIRGTTGTSSLPEAERMLNERIREIRDVNIHGGSPVVTFRDATLKYVSEKKGKRSIDMDMQAFQRVEPYIGDMDIRQVHSGSLTKFIADRQQAGCKNNTINRELASIRQVLSRAGRVWRHDNNLPYIEAVPLIEMLPDDSREPHQVSESEQQQLFGDLAAPYANYAMFLVNTGVRCREGLKLQWDWELADSPGFSVPASSHKNGKKRIVICNSIARSIVDGQRGRDSKLVFPIKEQAFRMAWDRARVRQGLDHIRRHDLKHTFGARLRAAGVGFADRKDLLGHKQSDITDHYCKAELDSLVTAAEKVVGRIPSPALRLVGQK